MKRPALKLPAAKPPAALADVYYDLRDRRLLPLLALIAVAIVAAPFLLGSDTEVPAGPAEAGAIAALKEAGERTSALTVVEAKPGLRDYRKRLRGRSSTDPFEQRYTAPVLAGSELNEAKQSETSGGGGKSTSTTTGGGSGKGSGGGAQAGGGGGKQGGGSGGKNGNEPHAVLYTFAVNLTITHSSGSKAEGDKQTSEPQKRKRVLPTTVLPGKKVQVVTYMGLSPKTRKPLFLVSDGVTGVFGDGKCISGADGCQLIELEPGFPELFEYGEGGDRYSIKVTKVELVFKGRV